MDTDEPSLQTRRMKLSLQYYIKLKVDLYNPAHSCVVNPELRRLLRSKPVAVPTLPWLFQQPSILSTYRISGRETLLPLSSRAC